MNKTFHLLLIEDQPEKWRKFFNKNKGLSDDTFHVDNVNTIQDGIVLIESKQAILDAVLIEYNFPETTQDQVLGSVKQIRKDYPTLPLFILCASSKLEDLTAITSFIKAGATNYFNISNFKPGYLAAHITAARENRRTLQKYEFLTTPHENSSLKPFLKVENNESSIINGWFAYLLEVVKKPRTDEEEHEFLEYAERWHREFFQMLILLIDDRVSLTLKFQKSQDENPKNPNTINIYWQFNLHAIDENDLRQEYEKTIRDLSLYLGEHSLFPYNPYIFSPVLNEYELDNLIVPKEAIHYHIKRKSVDWKNISHEVGYGHRKEPVKSRLQSIFTIPDDWLNINSFCKILLQEECFAQFEITVNQCHLSPEEKEEATKRSLINPDSFPLLDEQMKLYQYFLEGLARSTFKPFSIQYNFFTTGSCLNDAMQASILTAYALEKFEMDDKDDHSILFSDIYPDRYLPMFVRNPLPQKEGIPGITTLTQNMLFLPANLSRDGVRIGHKLLNNRWNDVRLSHTDLYQHAYILGQTGTGKSTLLYTMVMALLESGKPVSLIDPHGDLYDKVVQNLPYSCRDNTILFNASSGKDLPGIDFLQHDPGDTFQKTYLLNAMYLILDSLYDMKLTGGPIFLKYFQAAMKLVMENQGSLLDVISVFENEDLRTEFISKTTDPEVKLEWQEIEKTSGEMSFSNISVYITSKLNEFRNNLTLREILRKKDNQVDFGDLMNHGKNFLARLPVGTLGERGVNLVGQIIFNKFLMTAFSRERIKEEDRLNHVLVVDEFHKFTTDALGKVFSEARKYHLSLVVANQTLGQLKEEVQHQLLGNVGSMLFFRPGINDAGIVSRYLEPDFNSGELCNLPNFQCAARISINQRPSKPFVFETIRI